MQGISLVVFIHSRQLAYICSTFLSNLEDCFWRFEIISWKLCNDEERLNTHTHTHTCAYTHRTKASETQLLLISLHILLIFKEVWLLLSESHVWFSSQLLSPWRQYLAEEESPVLRLFSAQWAVVIYQTCLFHFCDELTVYFVTVHCKSTAMKY